MAGTCPPPVVGSNDAKDVDAEGDDEDVDNGNEEGDDEDKDDEEDDEDENDEDQDLLQQKESRPILAPPKKLPFAAVPVGTRGRSLTGPPLAATRESQSHWMMLMEVLPEKGKKVLKRSRRLDLLGVSQRISRQKAGARAGALEMSESRLRYP